VRCLAALSHIPPADVPEAFDLLAESMPAVEHLDEVVSYFEHTYIRGRRLRGRGENFGPALYPIETWNQMQAVGEGIARTNNICEGWYNGLQSLMQCNHPTMWRFLDGLHSDCIKQKTNFLHGVTGVQHPAEKNTAFFVRERYELWKHTGRLMSLPILRAIAHLSYQ